MKLIIAEKPSLGKAIAEWIGVTRRCGNTHLECKDDYVVTWLFGHILELYEPHEYHPEWKNWSSPLPIRPSAFKNQLKDDSGIKTQFYAIKDLVQNCTEIINAGDPDREGQLLVDEVLDYLGNKKPINRLWLAAIDDKSIAKAFQAIKPNSNYHGYKLAAETRQQADWLTGMNFTRAFTLRFQKKGYQNTFSIGRVQTPTLKLIVDRDDEIKNFVAKDFYELAAIFNNQTPEVKARLIVPELIKNLMDEDNRLLDRLPLDNIAEEISHQPAKVGSYEKQSRTKKQPLLYNLSSLQALANKKFGYSAQQVLDTAQLLYENKLTTYPRTDCQYLPESQFADSGEILANLAKVPEYSKLIPDNKIKSSVWNDKKVTAHHAIIPTGSNLDNLNSIIAGFGKNAESARNLFNLICIQYFAQFYPVMKYDEAEIIFNVKDYQFKATGRTITDKGWTILLDLDDEDDSTEEEKQLLPVLASGQETTCTDTIILSKKTQKPKPYTEGSLIQTMANIHNKIPEIVKQLGHDSITTAKLIDNYRKILKETAGLGTEATRAAIIETLKGKELIRSQGKNLIATDLGHLLINAMSGDSVKNALAFLASPLTTAEYEQKLDEIATTGSNEVLKAFWQSFDIQLNTVASFDKLDLTIPMSSKSISCPSCASSDKESALTLLKGKFGPYFKCFDCGSNFKEENGKPIISEAKPQVSTTGENCPECGQPLVERDGKFGKFISCSGYPSCKWTPPKKVNSVKSCPSCNTGQLVVRKGAKGQFLGCNAFPKCKHTEQLI